MITVWQSGDISRAVYTLDNGDYVSYSTFGEQPEVALYLADSGSFLIVYANEDFFWTLAERGRREIEVIMDLKIAEDGPAFWHMDKREESDV